MWVDIARLNKSNVAYVYSPESDRIRSIFSSRKDEIKSLLDNGKIIISFLHPLLGFQGEIRNRNDYKAITTYDYLPLNQDYFLRNLKAGSSSRTDSVKSNNDKSLFSPYYSAFKNEITYTAYFDFNGEGKSECFILNRGKRPVAKIYKSSNGLIVFLPPIPYKKDDQKLVGVVRSCANRFLTNHVHTPPPAWVDDYKLSSEEEYNANALTLQEEIESLQKQKLEIEEKKVKITQYKGLLYEQGSALEDIVIKSFQLLGFKAENRKHDDMSDMEHDVVFESEEGRGIAEIEGKDNDSIHISKLDQLNRAIDEDFELTGNYPQGILIGNHYRLTKPESRKEPFTKKVHIVAKKKSFGLLSTYELFKAIQYFLENPVNDTHKKVCRELILKTTGQEIRLEKK
ncbi:MAG: hypothetical protein H8D23_22230 [Candidatus Brocadiales bacterium]|nr:hypothetical protein [Candidatus Brocadiales bacterium]